MTDAADVELRPSLSAPRVRSLLLIGVPVASLTVVITVAIALTLPSVVTAVLALVVVGDYVILPVLYFRNTRLYLRGQVVGKVDVWGRRRELTVGLITSVAVERSGPRSMALRMHTATGVALSVYPTVFLPASLQAFKDRVKEAALAAQEDATPVAATPVAPSLVTGESEMPA